MTDYTKQPLDLLTRLRMSYAGKYSPLQVEAAAAIEALQGEVERMKDINRDALSNLNELCDAKNAEIAALAAELAAVRAVRDQLDKSWHDIARTAQLEAEALQAKLDELQRQKPVKFLVDATRFKTTMLANGKVLINDLPLELAGRWVAFVAAENDCHLKFAAPKALEPEIQPVNCDTCVYHYKDADQKPCNTCIHARDFYDNFEPRVTKGTP